MRFIDTFDIERMAQAAHSAGIHLADSREDWLKLMMSMAGGGERLLDSFLLLSSMAGSKFHEKENRREFLKTIRKSSDVGLKYFIDQCEAHGLSRNDFRKRQSSKSFSNHYRSNLMTPTKNTKTNNSMETLPTLKAEWVDKFRFDSKAAKDSLPNTFLTSVVKAGILSSEEARKAADLFRIGTTRKGEVVFWQIDENSQLRDGKVMMYDKHCHRCKDMEHHVDWVSHKFRYQKVLPMDWKPVHCLFGLHQIADETPEGKPSTVCVVEAEKTAFICSQKLDKYTWMASGGMNSLTVDTLKDLAGHRIILYPDTDTTGEAFNTWRKIAWEAKITLGLDITVSDFLEKNATDEQKERKIDIADWIMEDRLSPRPPFREGASDRDGEGAQNGTQDESLDDKSSHDIISHTEETEIIPTMPEDTPEDGQISEPLAEMIKDNPDVDYLIKTFGLVEERSG